MKFRSDIFFQQRDQVVGPALQPVDHQDGVKLARGFVADVVAQFRRSLVFAGRLGAAECRNVLVVVCHLFHKLSGGSHVK